MAPSFATTGRYVDDALTLHIPMGATRKSTSAIIEIDDDTATTPNSQPHDDVAGTSKLSAMPVEKVVTELRQAQLQVQQLQRQNRELKLATGGSKAAGQKVKIMHTKPLDSDIVNTSESEDHDSESDGTVSGAGTATLTISTASGLSQMRKTRPCIDPDTINPSSGLTNRIVAEIRVLGKEFAIMHEMFMPARSSSFWNEPPPTDTDAQLPLRTAGTTELDYCRLISLYSFLPPHLHRIVRKHKGFRKVFESAGRDARKHSVKPLRVVIPSIYGLPTNSTTSQPIPKRSTIEAISSLMKWEPDEPTPSYIPPLLCPGHDDNGIDTFRDERLALVGKVILRGESSVTRKNTLAHPPTNGDIWGVTSVTPGFISFTATMVRFVLSDDDKFASVGSNSRIDYQTCYHYYLDLFAQAIDTKPVQETLRFWNNIIFNTVPDASSDGPLGERPTNMMLNDLTARLSKLRSDSVTPAMTDSAPILTAQPAPPLITAIGNPTVCALPSAVTVPALPVINPAPLGVPVTPIMMNPTIFLSDPAPAPVPGPPVIEVISPATNSIPATQPAPLPKGRRRKNVTEVPKERRSTRSSNSTNV